MVRLLPDMNKMQIDELLKDISEANNDAPDTAFPNAVAAESLGTDNGFEEDTLSDYEAEGESISEDLAYDDDSENEAEI